jgi:transposase
MARIDLTDFKWSVTQPLLPQKSRGVPRVDDRRVLKGIFWLKPGRERGSPSRYVGAEDQCCYQDARYTEDGKDCVEKEPKEARAFPRQSVDLLGR